MALEIDHLVRSIENEVLQEDERERVRDVFARIEQIKDKVCRSLEPCAATLTSVEPHGTAVDSSTYL